MGELGALAAQAYSTVLCVEAQTRARAGRARVLRDMVAQLGRGKGALFKLVFVLAVSLGSIGSGYLAQRLLASGRGVSMGRIRTVSKYLKITAFFVLNPIAIFNSFWKLTLPSLNIIALPLLGILSIVIGAGSALIVIRLCDIPPHKAASVFVCGMLSNVLTLGGLIAFVMFGEEGYRIVLLFILFLSITYYLIGFPASDNIAKARPHYFKIDIRAVRQNPFLALPLMAVIAGVSINLSGLPRPAPLANLVAVVVPVTTVLLGLSIGITLRFSRIGGYRREVLVVLSFMPVAFSALVPPSIYGFDLDLANSAWVITTCGMVVVIPGFFLILG